VEDCAAAIAAQAGKIKRTTNEMSEIKAEGLRHVYSVGLPFEKVAIDNINVVFPTGSWWG
jgi:hypothetical protein